MSDTEDVTGEASERVKGYIILALTVGARAMEVHMHRRTQRAREAAMQSRQAAEATQRQIKAEVAATKQQLRDVNRDSWWEKATVPEIAGAYSLARAYERFDPEIGALRRRMADEITARYGIEPEELIARAEKEAQPNPPAPDLDPGQRDVLAAQFDTRMREEHGQQWAGVEDLDAKVEAVLAEHFPEQAIDSEIVDEASWRNELEWELDPERRSVVEQSLREREGELADRFVGEAQEWVEAYALTLEADLVDAAAQQAAGASAAPDRGRELDAQLTKALGENWPDRADVDKGVSVQFGYEDYGFIGPEAVAEARAWRAQQAGAESPAREPGLPSIGELMKNAPAVDQVAQRLEGAGIGGDAAVARMVVAAAQPNPITAAVAQGAGGAKPPAARIDQGKGADRAQGR